MEIWSGMVLLAVLAFVLGFALNHGSICTVIATTELIAERRPARSIALVECAVWAALVYAILEQSPTMQQGWSPLPYLVPGALLFGIGTYVNGACVFGSVGHFGNSPHRLRVHFPRHLRRALHRVSVWPAAGSAVDKRFPAARAGAARHRPSGDPGAEARSVAPIRVQLRAADAVDGSDQDHLYDPGGARAPVLDHDLGRIDRLDPCCSAALSPQDSGRADLCWSGQQSRTSSVER